MAEGGGDLREDTRLTGAREEDSVKLFVGQVPKHMTEEQLIALFKEVAIVDEVNIIRDKATKASRGCCFLICPSRDEADKAVVAYHNKRTLPGASSPLQVKYADGELERLEHKLFVGMLPKTVTDEELSDLFSKYGNIKDLQILRGSQQTSKGCAFLKYETKDQAMAALEALNGKHRMEGSNVPLVVKWADTEKERQARRAQKAQSQASKMGRNVMQQPSVYGALPVGYMPPYNGYSYQPQNYGLMQYPVSMQNQATYNSMFPPVNQGNSVRGAHPDASPGANGPKTLSAMQSAGYLGSPYSPVSGVQYPLSFQNNNRPPLGSNSHGQIGGGNSPLTVNNNSVMPSPGTSNSGTQIEGPPGANLFIYHIPQEYGDQDLATAFQSFGRVLSAKVFVDKATGVSKCFGFVSYDSPTAAQAAINMMNGYQLGGKKLKVQLKRENKQNKPF
ncbi:hypothetical protein LUZ62_027610 [Rhynchospora pubera]|uniref:RRM domain-containing protein n=1 Tax=Rhynchospora pubera TaxID=906938 RepID=A0AAV8HBG0_9POAL|nr:hypothetical protein LUZ62_027610 [Rhynchospora pubera]